MKKCISTEAFVRKVIWKSNAGNRLFSLLLFLLSGGSIVAVQERRASSRGHGKDRRTLKEWRAAEPLVDAWLSKKRPGTARKCGEDFRAYWLDHLSHRYKSIEDWLDAVKKAQFQPDF
jgi:hypothetical protein